MGDVIHVNFGGDEVSLDKEELAIALHRSVSWVEKMTKLGMPSTIRGRRRVYMESACRNWLGQHERGGRSCQIAVHGSTG